jgi:hypothetical protein
MEESPKIIILKIEDVEPLVARFGVIEEDAVAKLTEDLNSVSRYVRYIVQNPAPVRSQSMKIYQRVVDQAQALLDTMENLSNAETNAFGARPVLIEQLQRAEVESFHALDILTEKSKEGGRDKRSDAKNWNLTSQLAEVWENNFKKPLCLTYDPIEDKYTSEFFSFLGAGCQLLGFKTPHGKTVQRVLAKQKKQ